MRKKDVMLLLRQLRVKSRHEMYLNGGLTYLEYKEYINHTINEIRAFFRLSRYSNEDFDILWSNLNMAADRWKTARNEIFMAIAS